MKHVIYSNTGNSRYKSNWSQVIHSLYITTVIRVDWSFGPRSKRKVHANLYGNENEENDEDENDCLIVLGQ